MVKEKNLLSDPLISCSKYKNLLINNEIYYAKIE